MEGTGITIKVGIFSGLANLRVLKLGNNEIACIEDGLFSGLDKLEKLYLDHNKLRGDMNTKCFRGLNLVYLNLTFYVSCRQKRFNLKFVEDMMHIKSICLKGLQLDFDHYNNASSFLQSNLDNDLIL